MKCFSDLAIEAAQMATGVLGWSPETFWTSTAAELALAFEGRAGSHATPPLDRSELDQMQRKAGNGG